VTVAYSLACDTGWHFRSLTMSVASAGDERTLTLACEDGRWLANGTSRPDLVGCVDIDISCTPLTNTLPIRRLGWGTAHDIDVAYVSVPELEVRRVRQRYTRLEGDGQFRYESGSFQRDLSVDDGGFVLDYPGLWRRIGSLAEASR
jgi:uncharacterized protein